MTDSLGAGAPTPAAFAVRVKPAALTAAPCTRLSTLRCALDPFLRPAHAPLVIPVLIAVIVLVLAGVSAGNAVAVVLAAGAAANQLKRSA